MDALNVSLQRAIVQLTATHPVHLPSVPVAAHAHPAERCSRQLPTFRPPRGIIGAWCVLCNGTRDGVRAFYSSSRGWPASRGRTVGIGRPLEDP